MELRLVGDERLRANGVVAVVEDSPEDGAAFSRVFGAYGEIKLWTTGEAAIDALSAGEVKPTELAMLIVDLYLPGANGVDVIKAVRGLPGGAHAAIFALSSSTSEADSDRALRAGADEFIVKPRDLAGLRELAARLVDLTA